MFRFFVLFLAITLVGGGCSNPPPAAKKVVTAEPRSCAPPAGVTLTAKDGDQLDWSRVDKGGVARVFICDGDGIARAVRVTGLTLGSRALDEPNAELALATTSLVPVEVPDLGVTVQCLKLWTGGCDPVPVVVPSPVAPPATVSAAGTPTAAVPVTNQ